MGVGDDMGTANCPQSYGRAAVACDDDGSSGHEEEAEDIDHEKESRHVDPPQGWFLRSLLLIAALPSQASVVLLLELLNSFRGAGLRQVQFQYLTSEEFAFSDEEAGVVIGIRSSMDVVFGLLGSFLTDCLGVRATSLSGMSAAVVGRALIAFGRSRQSLKIAYFFFSPFGEAVLYTGLYKVALKKLTPPRIRTLAFAISYAVNNLGYAMSSIALDIFRSQHDFHVTLNGKMYIFTGNRSFLVATWVVAVFACLLAWCFVKNETVFDEEDPDPGLHAEDLELLELGANPAVPAADSEGSGGVLHRSNSRPRPQPSSLDHGPGGGKGKGRSGRGRGKRRGGGGQEEAGEVSGDQATPNSVCSLWRYLVAERQRRVRSYHVIPTERASHHAKLKAAMHTSDGKALSSIVACLSDFLQLLQLRELWMVVLFSLCSFPVAAQWSASNVLMPAFLERTYGESVPIFTIASINFWGCVFLPPLVALVTSSRETFGVIMPGFWLMALSPVFLAFLPTPSGAALWQTVLTLGEVLWSPRAYAWAATLAPVGREGVFLAFASAREALAPILDVVYAFLAHAYVPNCRSLGCRDTYGHFCSQVLQNGTCASEEGACEIRANMTSASRCPSSCADCPGWSSQPFVLWGLVACASMLGPLLAWLLLPFLQGGGSCKAGCYGVLSCSQQRLLGMCGAGEASTREREGYGNEDAKDSAEERPMTPMTR